MIFRNRVLFILFKILGKVRVIDVLVIFIYRYVLFPLVKAYLHLSHTELLKVEYRHSVNSFQNFNAFMSDLDITLIIKDDTDPQPILKTYLALKKYFIMLDYPEIYYQKERLILDSFKLDGSLRLVELCWNIRKINWNLSALKAEVDEFNIIKKKRSISISFKKILQSPGFNHSNIFNIEEIKYINEFIPSDSSEKSICHYSWFLETTKSESIKILVSAKQFPFFNSLMPGEIISEDIAASVSKAYLQTKASLEFHELYLSKSSVRLKIAIGHDPAPVLVWIKFLERKLGLTT